MLSRKTQSGFTLIELITVIVLLGVLSAFALPRFADLSRNAQVAVLEQTKGALMSTSAIFHSKALVENVSDGLLNVEGGSALLHSGYLAGAWNTTWRQVLNLGKDMSYTQANQRCEKNELCVVGTQPISLVPSLPITGSSVSGLMLIWPKGYLISDDCYVYYFNPENGSDPSIGMLTSGC